MTTPPAPARRSRVPRIQELGLLVVIFALSVGLYMASPTMHAGGVSGNTFLRASNLIPNVLTPMSWFAIMAIGETFVIVAGGIDISVGSIFGLAALSCAAATQLLPADSGPALALSIAAGVPVAVGVACGLINGLLVTFGRMHPFIVTLATLSIFRGIAINSVQEQSLPSGDRSLPEAFTTHFMMYELPYKHLQPIPVVIMLIALAAAWAYLALTIWGRQNYAVGGNEEAARFSGLPIKGIKLRVYMLAGLAAGVAGFISCGYYGSANTATGAGYELTVIAAAVVGGASLAGGRGTALGAVLGMLIIQLIENGIAILKQINLGIIAIPVHKEYALIIIGVAILIAVAIDNVSQHLRSRRLARGNLIWPPVNTEKHRSDED